MTISNIKAIIPCEIDRVWKIIVDVDHYDTWRSDLSKTETINKKQFVEYTCKGYPTTFTVTSIETHRRWEFDMENKNMKGHWIGVFVSKGDETEIDFTEYVTAKNFLIKPFVRLFLKSSRHSLLLI